jgi:hypothetical protein
MPKLKKIFLPALTFLSLSSATNAMVDFTFSESATQVLLTVTGNIDLDATLGSPSVATNTNILLAPSLGAILAGSAVNSDFYNISLSGWTSYGSGAVSGPGSGSGDRISLFDDGLGLPVGYISGSSIASTSAWDGSFASLGLTPGSYTSVFNNGSFSDSVTVTVVPEPSVAALFLGLGALGVVLRRRAK